MAQHRKQRPDRWSAPRRARRAPVPAALRAAATLTLAGAASAAVLDGAALAEPEATLAEVEERVDALHREAEVATEAYHAATEAAGRAEEEVDRLRDRAARRTEELNAARRALGSQASAEYRAGGLPAGLALALSADPDDFLSRAGVVDRSGARQARAALDIEARLRGVEQLRAEAAERSEALADARERAREQREVVTDRLARAEDLLATRTARERAEVLREEGTGKTAGGGRAAPAAAPAVAANQRAGAAVAFAWGQLGRPYGWGATGPDAYDCSGLTQAAWRAAGVSLPRTSYSQAAAGARVPRSALAPGDLVFYYADFSHVGIYVGDGLIVHASRPGTPVRVAPVDSMPFTAAVRPG
ncbi:C40 family peptidase [Streptomyces marincola]|uniref:C40 family peptidase n=1 Tax=Streptomyces marincola TaxID=2878388 RepID=UPI001CF3672B|nr:C40 family peptidase [Streptomyces marincola]UCM89939.1 NlpC/P60 family protein [Streptomyces marincola]